MVISKSGVARIPWGEHERLRIRTILTAGLHPHQLREESLGKCLTYQYSIG